MSDYKKFDFHKIKVHARELRKCMTESEKQLWKELRGRKLSGYKFHRRYPILYNGNLIRYNYFIADFYCAEKKLIIELDGSVHNSSKEYEFIVTPLYEVERGRGVSACQSKVLRVLYLLIFRK